MLVSQEYSIFAEPNEQRKQRCLNNETLLSPTFDVHNKQTCKRHAILAKLSMQFLNENNYFVAQSFIRNLAVKRVFTALDRLSSVSGAKSLAKKTQNNWSLPRGLVGISLINLPKDFKNRHYWTRCVVPIFVYSPANKDTYMRAFERTRSTITASLSGQRYSNTATYIASTGKGATEQR